MATPLISCVLAPLKKAVAGKESSSFIDWNHSLTQRFREAKSHTLYLPHTDDQLLIQADAAQNTTGIGLIVYAIKGKELIPV